MFAAEKLARKLYELAPGDLDRAFFVNSGSEASEYANTDVAALLERARPCRAGIGHAFQNRAVSDNGEAMGTQITSPR